MGVVTSGMKLLKMERVMTKTAMMITVAKSVMNMLNNISRK